MRISLRRALPVLLGLLALAGVASAEYSIYSIQLGQIPQNTIVDVNDVVITAVGRFGFFVQEPNPDPVYGRQYSGLWVYTNTQPTLHRGDMVNLRGKYYEYNCAAGGSPCQTELDIFCSDCQGRVTKTGTATVPDPVPMTIPEVNDAGAWSAAYEGVLVRVDRDDNTLIAQSRVDSYNWMLKRGVGQDSIMVTKWSSFPGGDFNYDIPAPGQAVTFAAGVLTWKSSHYRLAPRDCDYDLGLPCPLNLQGAWATSSTQIGLRFGQPVTQASAETVSNYELQSGWEISSATLDPTDHKRVFLVTDDLGTGNQETVLVHGLMSEQGVQMVGVQSASFRTGITPIRMVQEVEPGGDTSPLLNEIVTVHGKVTALDGANYYYIQDDDGGPWDGLYIYVARQSNRLKVRDMVTVAGQVREYVRSGFSSGQTELGYINGVDWFQFTPNFVDPVVTTVTPSQVRYRDGGALSAEPYEECLVRISNAIVDSLAGRVGPYFGEWLLRQQGNADTTQLGRDGINGYKSYKGCIGDILNLTGVVGYDYGTYWIWPRSDRGGDIQVTYDNPACAPSGVDDVDALVRSPYLHGAPNPFNPRTTIRFRLDSNETVGLVIVDPSGRIVRTLLQRAAMKAGERQVGWDGTDDAGRSVGSGAYFARLQSSKGTIATKLVLLK